MTGLLSNKMFPTGDQRKWSRKVGLVFWLLLLAGSVNAQNPAPGQPDPLMTLMLTAPRLATDRPVAPVAKFDPPVIAPGGHSTYRVTLHTLESAITRWPEKLPAPPPLEWQAGARGQILQQAGGIMEPLTVINYRVTAAGPGGFTVPAFDVEIYGRRVTIPEARLEVVAGNPNLPPRELLLESSTTNVFVGQPLHLRVLLPAGAGNAVQMLSLVQLNGDGFLAGKNAVSQQIAPVRLRDGRVVTAYIYETVVTPFAPGALKISAQGFTVGNQFGGPMVIQGGGVIPGGAPEYALLESEPLTLEIKPLPPTGRRPGFTGALGKFTGDKPLLSATNIAVGDPVKLTVTFHGEENIAHLVMPPPPNTPAWRAFAAVPGPAAGDAATFTFTFIPLTEDTAATPEIPFCYFDPNSGQYIDLSIPACAITVRPGSAPADASLGQPWPTDSASEKKLTLSALAKTPGRIADTLLPLQQRGGFFLVELGPVLLLLGLWSWSRRCEYLEQHPDILRRRHARRALRREWHQLRRAARAGDARAFAVSAVNALRVGCAPHFPAAPRALVCADILPLLPAADHHGALVRRLFTATDEMDFAKSSAESAGLLELQPELERLLEQLEARL